MERQSVNLPVAGSADERSDPKQVSPLKLSVLRNVDLSETGAIKKRRPYANIASGRWPLRATQRDLVLKSDYNLAEYLPSGETGKASYLGKQCQLSRTDLKGDGDQWYRDFHSSVASDDSVWVSITRYTGSSGGYTWELARYDSDGRALVSGVVSTAPGASQYAKVLAWDDGAGNTGVVALFLDGGSLKAQQFSAAGVATGIPYTIGTAGTADVDAFDVCRNGNTGFVSYGSSFPASGVYTYQIDLTSSTGSPTLYDSWSLSGDPSLVSCEFITGADDVMVASQNATSGIEVRNATTGSSVASNASATSNVFALAIGQHGSNALVTYLWTVSTHPFTYMDEVTPALSVTDSHAVASVQPVSKAISTSHGTYLVVLRQPSPTVGNYQEARSFHLCMVGGPSSGDDMHLWPVANFAYDEAYHLVSRAIPPLRQLSTGELVYAGMRIAFAQTFEAAPHLLTGLSLWKFDFDIRKNYSTASIGGVTVIAGAAPTFYDGRGVQMLGHPTAPTIKDVTGGTTGSLTPDSTYTWIAVYEFRDAQGRVWRSPPSQPVTKTLVGGQDSATIRVYAPLNRIHVSGEYQVQIALYRNTQANPTIYRRVTDPSDPANTQAYTFGWNAGSGAKSIEDTSPDSALATNELLYTTGGVLENQPAPPLRCVAEHRNRLFGVHAETGDIWATKEYLPGEGLHFTLIHRISNPVQGEIPTALVSTEGALVVVYGTRIGQVFGDGLNNLGQGEWSQIEFLPGDKVGTYSHRAVETIPEGLVLVDRHSGPYLMPYGGTPQRIGDVLPITTWDFDSVVGVDYLEDREEVRFTLYDGSYRAWHPKANAWTTGDGPGSQQAEMTAVWDGAHAIGYVSGTAYLETSGSSYADEASGRAPALTLETAWVKLAQMPGIQGRFRLRDAYFIGEYLAEHNLTLQVAYDYDDADTYETTVEDAVLSSLSPYQVRLSPNRQQVQAIKLIVTEWFTGEGGPQAGSLTSAFKLSQIRLDFGVYPRGGRPKIRQGGRV